MDHKEFNAVLSQKIDLTDRLGIFRIKPDGWRIPHFEPGQFTVLGVPGTHPVVPHAENVVEQKDPEKMIKRPYSIASSPNNRLYIELYIDLVSEGSLTPRLFALKVGDRLFMKEKKAGFFTIRDTCPDDADIVFIATGTGLAPFLSYLRTIDISRQNRNIILFWGCRYSTELAYHRELLALQEGNKNFHYRATISRSHVDPLPWDGRLGRVDQFWGDGTVERFLGYRPNAETNCHFYLCGSMPMIKEWSERLIQLGMEEHQPKSPGKIHFESYY
ncbi:MAG TPA: ferredoxin--NADP reductase [bacterium]|jgi:ferredoxin--NADP+ reductase